jgi:hypothetical protein
MSSVLNEDLDLHLGVKTMEDLFGYLNASEDAFFLDKQFAAAHGISRDATKGSVVAITDIFGKCEVNKSVVKFVYC